MDITTVLNGTTALLAPRGPIDGDSLHVLREAAAALPSHVTTVDWDMSAVPFMDSAGLHLLLDPPFDRQSKRRARVTGLAPQPARLLAVAEQFLPALDAGRLLRAERSIQAA
ncbi:STAS domain-containing protein [Streptomyces sp. NPDC060235]|uniref:STAS domain-containing protein n=1 Tax=unclassified Streptomyces TaxID=2593676 RepID=UPI003646A19D